MINTDHPQPLKDLVFACQSYLHWRDEYDSEHEWTAMKNATDFLERIRQLVPQCIEIVKHDAVYLDCE